MKKIAAVFAAIFLFAQFSFAQKTTLFGLVTNEKSEIIDGAVVFL